jgi:hypothetical protein
MGFFRPSPEQLAKRAEKRAKRLQSSSEKGTGTMAEKGTTSLG